jgi:hypothetical protein
MSAGHYFEHTQRLATTKTTLSETHSKNHCLTALVLTGHRFQRSMLLRVAGRSKQVILPSNSHTEAADNNEVWQMQLVNCALLVRAL